MRQCVKKSSVCTEFQRYDAKTQQCVQLNFITSAYLENLVYTSGDFKDYIALYESRMSKEVLKDCPLSVPYFNALTKTCINCPASNPYFDLEKNLCIACNAGFAFNPYEKKCKKMVETTYP